MYLGSNPYLVVDVQGKTLFFEKKKYFLEHLQQVLQYLFFAETSISQLTTYKEKILIYLCFLQTAHHRVIYAKAKVDIFKKRVKSHRFLIYNTFKLAWTSENSIFKVKLDA